VPTSSRSPGDTGTIDNEFGAMALPLPVWEADAERRLGLIAARTREAKAGQHPAAVMGLLARLSATPLGRYFAAHQHAVDRALQERQAGCDAGDIEGGAGDLLGAFDRAGEGGGEAAGVGDGRGAGIQEADERGDVLCS
jgi:hypothetical protein